MSELIAVFGTSELSKSQRKEREPKLSENFYKWKVLNSKLAFRNQGSSYGDGRVRELTFVETIASYRICDWLEIWWKYFNKWSSKRLVRQKDEICVQ